MKKIIALISTALILSCGNKMERVIPIKPFVIIDIEPYSFGVSNYAYKYKVIDKNGYVFYFSESSAFREQPNRQLGDTLK